MEVRIRITAPPPSNVAPDNIREAWVGVEMKTVSGEEIDSSWSGNANADGYVVSGIVAVQGLIDAGKTEAARYWSCPKIPSFLRFGQEFCEVIEE
jgi:hypothetical protein